MRRRMYNRNIFSDLFRYKDAVRQTPFTDESLCWPMSFLYCCLRRYIINENKVIDVNENTPISRHSILPNNLYRMIPVVNKELGVLLLSIAPQVIYKDENNNYSIVLFNPYKTKDRCSSLALCNTWLLEECTTPIQLGVWQEIAKNIHHFVCEKTNSPNLLWTDLDGCGKAYADVFQVIIHIVRVEAGMKRAKIYHPVIQLDYTILDHDYLLFGDDKENFDHCHAVTNR